MAELIVAGLRDVEILLLVPLDREVTVLEILQAMPSHTQADPVIQEGLAELLLELTRHEYIKLTGENFQRTQTGEDFLTEFLPTRQ